MTTEPVDTEDQERPDPEDWLFEIDQATDYARKEVHYYGDRKEFERRLQLVVDQAQIALDNHRTEVERALQRRQQAQQQG